MKIAVLGSTRGSVLGPYCDALCASGLPAVIKVVISDRPNAGILQKAQALGIKTIAHPKPKDQTSHAYDHSLNQLLQQEEVDVVVMIGYMRIVHAPLLEAWANRMINTHPSLLPRHGGLMDLAVHQSVLDAKEDVSGCSVHMVTQVLDGGEVLVQLPCMVYEGDTKEILKKRVQSLEPLALLAATKLLM